MQDITKELSDLLGRTVPEIRKTNQGTPRVAVVDVIMAITGQDRNHSALCLRRVFANYPEVKSTCIDVEFPDAMGRIGRHASLVTDAKGIIDIIMILPGQQAARLRRQVAALLVRFLGGDLTLIDEVCAIRGIQEQLAVQDTENPMRIFGRQVEESADVLQSQLAKACTNAFDAAAPHIIEGIANRISDNFVNVGGTRRINLNVRASKRSNLRDPAIAQSIEGLGQPLPVAKFLDEKEIDDPTWRGVRRNIAPFFGMQIQVLKKRKLKEEGEDPIYVEQNHRPQLFYTERDRNLMQEAWEMISAHREDIVNRFGASMSDVSVIVPPVPRVIALLQRQP